MIITDTGAFVALINSRDEYHDLVKPAFAVKSEPLITTYPVISETCHLLKRSAGLKAEQLFLQTRDFSIYRWNSTQSFQNLLFSDR